MKILQVNKFHYFRGGAETYYLKISEKLKREGHQVANFSMHHPKNLDSNWSKYFVTELNFTNPKLRDKILALGRIFYNWEAKRKFSKLVRDFQPDIIHCHNIYYHISPSILTVARRNNISVIMHLHDYNLICPNYSLYTKGKICYKCQGKKYYKCLLNKCFNDSWGKTILATWEKYFHNSALKIYDKTINLYISPSKFLKQIFLDFGYKDKSIQVLPNFTQKYLSQSQFYSEQDYFLYFGRLSQEKGIHVILQALASTDKKLTLKIAGTGPQERDLYKQVKKLNLESRVEFLGWKNPQELETIISQARAVIMPSLWLENMPFSLLESLERSKVVIASRIGGFKEIIQSGKNGFLFKPGDHIQLKNILTSLEEYDLEDIKEQARITAQNLNLDSHIKKLVQIYRDTINRSQ